MTLPFFSQPQTPSFFLGIVVLDLQTHDRAHAGEGKSHDGDEGAIAQTDDGGSVHAVEQLAGLDRRDHRRSPLADGVTRTPDGVRRVGGDHLAGDQPVEEHADAGQVLFDGRGGTLPCNCSI